MIEGHGTRNVLLKLQETVTGVWEFEGEHAPEAIIRIVRHDGELCYRVNLWRADGDDGRSLGYHTTLIGAARTISSYVYSRDHPYQRPNLPRSAAAITITRRN